jgi:hypothetical protein
MKQATALYGSTDSNESEALGTTMTMLSEDLRAIPLYVLQVTISGDQDAYSVEFTLNVPDCTNPIFDQAEDYEVLN